jgi:pyridoxine 5-phosphate synthase
MNGALLKLGVNIDHVATLRQARGTDYPDVVAAVRFCEEAGADGITAHLREDRRHIQDADMFALREAVRTRLNMEMAVDAAIVEIALRVRPDEVCLVPERRQELTTEGGLDVAGCREAVGAAVGRLAGAGILVSLFIAPDPAQVEAAAAVGAPCIELHTGAFCDLAGAARAAELDRLVAAARRAHALGLQVNAGHGINLGNLAPLLDVPHLDTLNIGHSIVAHAVFVGLAKAVRAMREAMRAYRGGVA